MKKETLEEEKEKQLQVGEKTGDADPMIPQSLALEEPAPAPLDWRSIPLSLKSPP